MSEMHIADALEQGIFDIKDGCAKTMTAPHSVMEQAARLIRSREDQVERLETENAEMRRALRVAHQTLICSRDYIKRRNPDTEIEDDAIAIIDAVLMQGDE